MAGHLRFQVSIQKPTPTLNNLNEPEITWTDVSTGVWASIEPLRGREYFAAKQVNAEIDARITMRYRAGVQTDYRILHGSNEYYIVSIINVEERNRELQLMCTRSIL